MPALPSTFGTLLSRASGRPRKFAAVTCLILAVFSLVSARKDPSTQGEPVLVAARNLAAGSTLTDADITVSRWPAQAVPEHRLSDSSAAVGKVVGAAMGRGEPLTAMRLLDGAITDGLGAGQRAVAIPIVDNGESSIIAAGSRVDLYSAPAASGTGATQTKRLPLASEVRVLAVVADAAGRDRAVGAGGRTISVVIAASPEVAGRVASRSSAALLATLGRPS
jgi:pilus assembly protein CpaB